MTPQRAFHLSVSLTSVVLIVGVAIFNGLNLAEAYGSGAPYFSRTTNMDKWTDPLPALYATDALTVGLTVGYFCWTRRAR
ncbi:hypothetical protein C0Z18_27315 [Trinickia dabaoshanensis]|uniref:Uncharacterized protein n=1 Tax=Trinickia dabaoshanensis TaxID=564714 RepID=A0A2N7VDY6_9BURK|nr:hypothetical protein C0Z18_27315 [Trinickia dabaoshanensis]